MRVKAAIAVVLVSGTIASAQSITTLFGTNNSGAAGGAVYFNVNPTVDLTINSFNVNTAAPLGSQFGFSVYTMEGTHVGSEGNPGIWTLRTTGTGTGAGVNLPSQVVQDMPFDLFAGGTTGMAIVLAAPGFPSAAHSYTNGTGTNQFFQNSEVSLTLGSATNAPFGGGAFTPRVWNGTIHYTPSGVPTPGACCFQDGTCTSILPANCLAQGGNFRGVGTDCATAECPQPGACCFADGTCDFIIATACAAAGGTFTAPGTTCAAANCPAPGACCMPDGCALVFEAVCNFAGGTFQGGGTTCTNCALPAGFLHVNGPMRTGELAQNFVPAPPGSHWSECPHPYDRMTFEAPANSTAGANGSAPTFRMADDFTVPAGAQWEISELLLYAYQTGSSEISTFTAATVQIWDGVPNSPGATVVWGDTTTNRLASSSFSNTYRTFNTVVGISCGGTPSAAGTTRPIMELVVNVNHTLPAGTYWIDYNTSGSLASGPWVPYTSILGWRQTTPYANARQWTGAAWQDSVDAGQGCAPQPVRQELTFRIKGVETTGCYANCDESTTEPILNVDDFTCFINAFAAAQSLPHEQQITSYANCDSSTTAPVLNVDDFTCFINAFAQGCP